MQRIKQPEPVDLSHSGSLLQNLDFTLPGSVAQRPSPRKTALLRIVNLAAFTLPMMLLLFGITIGDISFSLPPDTYATGAPCNQTPTTLDTVMLIFMITVPLAMNSPRVGRVLLLPYYLFWAAVVPGVFVIAFLLSRGMYGQGMPVLYVSLLILLLLSLIYILCWSVLRACRQYGLYIANRYRFDRCTIESCEFGWSWHPDSTLINCNFEDCRLRWATLSDVAVTNCTFRRCWFWVDAFGPKTLSGCTFRDCIIIFTTIEDPAFFTNWSGTMIRIKSFVLYARGG